MKQQSKIAIITDTHWGVRNDNIAFMNSTKKFLDEVFFPKLKEESITHIIHLGDIVDRRKHISYLTANRLRTDFLDKLVEYGITADIIAGNHDCYYKNTNRVNALSELIDGSYSNIECFIEPTEVIRYNTPMLFLPWICDENREQSTRMINESKSSICMGHLQIVGFEMFRGSVATHGDERTTFDKFSTTLSGHFHHRSSDGSITYLGSHSEFTWADYSDPRGFHIFSLPSQTLEFVKNPFDMFKKIWYNDEEKKLNELLDFDTSQYENTMLKVIVTNKNNPYWFDLFCGKLEKANPLNMQIVEDHLNLNLENEEDITSEAESTLDIFRKHIGQLTASNMNIPKLEKVITDLYNKAQLIE